MLFFAAILVPLFLLAIIFLADSSFGGLDFATSRLVARKVVEIVRRAGLENGNFYDLGSCRGFLSIKIARALPHLQVLGVDNSRFRTWFAKVRSVFIRNVTFLCKDVFTTHISLANVVYIYLPKELMAGLQNKMQRELRPGSLVITHKVSFPSWEPVETHAIGKQGTKKLFIYKCA